MVFFYYHLNLNLYLGNRLLLYRNLELIIYKYHLKNEATCIYGIYGGHNRSYNPTF